jgi:hypothetical protein
LALNAEKSTAPSLLKGVVAGRSTPRRNAIAVCDLEMETASLGVDSYDGVIIAKMKLDHERGVFDDWSQFQWNTST